MSIEKIEILRYSCDGNRLDCWESEDYMCDEDAKQDGWATNGKQHLCPYCASKIGDLK